MLKGTWNFIKKIYEKAEPQLKKYVEYQNKKDRERKEEKKKPKEQTEIPEELKEQLKELDENLLKKIEKIRKEGKEELEKFDNDKRNAEKIISRVMLAILVIAFILGLFFRPEEAKGIKFVQIPIETESFTGSLAFKPKLPNIPSTRIETGLERKFRNLFKTDTGYKEERARYAYNYARSVNMTDEQAMYMVAQLHRENGAWSETTRGDNGCSVGLIQWNECARGKLPIEYSDWQGQIRIMIGEIATKMYFHSFDMARVSWNNPSVLTTGMYKTVYYYDIEKTKKLFNF